jgi:hypothetical protein
VIRVPVAAVGAITVAATLAAPAHADVVDNSFLAALSNAGITYGAPATTIALGHSVCPMLVEPQGNFDSVVSSVADISGMSKDVAGAFALIALSEYCPAIMSPLVPRRLRA